jgi:hypothetical protein
MRMATVAFARLLHQAEAYLNFCTVWSWVCSALAIQGYVWSKMHAMGWRMYELHWTVRYGVTRWTGRLSVLIFEHKSTDFLSTRYMLLRNFCHSSVVKIEIPLKFVLCKGYTVRLVYRVTYVHIPRVTARHPWRYIFPGPDFK